MACLCRCMGVLIIVKAELYRPHGPGASPGTGNNLLQYLDFMLLVTSEKRHDLLFVSMCSIQS